MKTKGWVGINQDLDIQFHIKLGIRISHKYHKWGENQPRLRMQHISFQGFLPRDLGQNPVPFMSRKGRLQHGNYGRSAPSSSSWAANQDPSGGVSLQSWQFAVSKVGIFLMESIPNMNYINMDYYIYIYSIFFNVQIIPSN
jgi:hypothetical protein